MDKLKIVWNIVNSKIFLLLVSVVLTAFLKRESDSAERWENNYSISINTSDTLRDSNGKLITHNKMLRLTISELKQSNDSILLNMIKELAESRIRLRNADNMVMLSQSYSKDLDIEIMNRDSLIMILEESGPLKVDPVPIEYRKIPMLLVGKYEDEHTNAEILYQSGNWKLKYNATNKAYGVLYHQRDKVKWLLGLRLGQKRYWFDYKETNPNISTEVKFINIKRGKR